MITHLCLVLGELLVQQTVSKNSKRTKLLGNYNV